MADKPLSEITTQASRNPILFPASLPMPRLTRFAQNSNQPEQHSSPESAAPDAQESAVQNGSVKATLPGGEEPVDVPNGVANALSDGAASSASAGQPSSSPVPPPLPAPVDTGSSPAQPSPPATKEKPDEVDSSRDAEKDRTSVNTSTHTHTRTQSTRRKEDKKSNSDLAHTVSTSAGAAEPQQRKPARTTKKKVKPSLFSKLFRVLVPCISSASTKHAHAVDVDLPPPTEAAGPSTEVKEKPLVKEPESKPAEQPSPPATDAVPEQATAPRQTTPIPPPLQPVDIPPPSDDPAVVVPPTPTKTLPPEETAGLTSGAVQPPGSRGATKREDSLHEVHRHESENESDASTSFTDDEEGEDGTHMDEVEDEEERLIANGGAGIPIGAVRVMSSFTSGFTDADGFVGRCATSSPSSTVPETCRAKMSRPRLG